MFDSFHTLPKHFQGWQGQTPPPPAPFLNLLMKIQMHNANKVHWYVEKFSKHIYAPYFVSVYVLMKKLGNLTCIFNISKDELADCKLFYFQYGQIYHAVNMLTDMIKWMSPEVEWRHKQEVATGKNPRRTALKRLETFFGQRGEGKMACVIVLLNLVLKPFSYAEGLKCFRRYETNLLMDRRMDGDKNLLKIC